MLKMTLNNNSNKYMLVTSYTRNLDAGDPDIRFNLDFNFEGAYSADGIEYLADQADTLITAVKIVDNNGSVMLNTENIKGKLRTLMESGDDNGRRGYGSIAIYEATATI